MKYKYSGKRTDIQAAHELVVELCAKNPTYLKSERAKQTLLTMVSMAIRQAEARGVMRSLDVTCCGHWRCPEISRTQDLARKSNNGYHPDFDKVE